MTTLTATSPVDAQLANAGIIARLERLPVTPRLQFIRLVIGIATFFDGYTVLAIAFAMPQLITEWNIDLSFVGIIIAAGYVGQFFGAILFGSLAEKYGRTKILFATILLFVSMDIACLFAWSAYSMLIFRFIQGIGTGGEVPVASAYINEFVVAKTRGKFFLLYEVVFLIDLLMAGMTAYFLIPIYGWKVMFIVGLIPSFLIIPLRFFMPESPRWLASKGRFEEADKVVKILENSAIKAGHELVEPEIKPLEATPKASSWLELFQGIYKKRTFMLWGLWFCVYIVVNGLVTWLPTLYKTHFNLPLQTALGYGWTTSVAGVVAAVICALLIDKVGRKRWYKAAFFLAIIPLGTLVILGAKSAQEVLIFASLSYAILQTISYSLYLYTSELYPTRLRAIGSGFSSACLRLGSSIGPIAVGAIVAGYGIEFVFAAMAIMALIGGLIITFYGIETKGQPLEQLSP